MRLFVFASAFVTFTLCSCSAIGTKQAAVPQDVLARSVHANAQIENVRMQVNLQYELTGQTQEKGQLQFAANTASWFQSLSGSGSMSRRVQKSNGLSTIAATMDIAMETPALWYVRYNTASFDLANDALNATPFLRTWWKMTDADTNSAEQETFVQTPDPTIITAILESVVVDRDDGIVTEGNEKLYHYYVHIDAAALGETAASLPQAPMGEVWIDAETFLLKRAIWSLADIPTKTGHISTSMDIRLSHQNEQLPLLLPIESRNATSEVWRMFHTILPSALLPE
ncbi:MAG: hypothetical protein KBD00_02630 [Candidatus Peribacteraceae bacterium]|nr:hypothetical protein [Candidatus Peribacteraceae bacterium]